MNQERIFKSTAWPRHVSEKATRVADSAKSE